VLNIFFQYKKIFFVALKKIAKENNIQILEQDFNNFTVEPSKEVTHGSIACNIAMCFSKKFSIINALNSPKKLAEAIINSINDENIEKIEIANPGFINVFLDKKIFYQIVEDLLSSEKYQFPNLGNNIKINLEYASPNPTGPIHVGHCRGAIYGDVLASLLQKVGYDVLKEYYINDAGSQIKTLLESAYLRYLQSFGKQIEIPEGLYPGEYLIEIGNKLKNKFSETLLNKAKEEYFLLIRDFVIEQMVEIIKSDLLSLGIKHDSYFSEKKNLHDTGKIEEAIEELRKKDLIYVGKLEAPKTEKGVGAMPEGYDEKDQTLFRSTKFGDDQDRVIKKSDGNLTYFAADLAYIKSKFERGAKIFIMPLGSDHAGYIKRMNAATEALTENRAKLKIILCQMVKFVKNGQPLKMSKRAGNFISAKEVIDEVGADALRFIMLTRKNDAPFDFDLVKVIEQSKDNPIFYVQYAHTRCCSVLRQDVEKKYQNKFDQKILENLQDESEINLIKKIAQFPRIIEIATVNFEPHKIAFYLQELAAEFHALWNKGMENPNLKFIIKENEQLTQARFALINAVKKIIKTGLEIFNINALEEMR
jgi:arginyl-tRNA synthetase